MNSAERSESPSNTIGNLITAVDKVLRKEKPDALLVLGDTNSCLAVIPAKRMKIPIFHMEAGNRCFDQRVPEEINRKIVDHTSDINLTYSSIAREYLLREGFPPDQVIKIGSPMNEVLSYYLPKIEASKILKKLVVKPREYFLASIHREENIDPNKNLNAIIETLNELSKFFQQPIYMSTHPRTKAKIEKRKMKLASNIHLIKPLGFFDYVKLQKNARIVLSDSGTITEESNILNFPAINLREVHERPEGMEEGAVMMTGLKSKTIFNAIHLIENQGWHEKNNNRSVSDYSWTNVSEKVLRIVVSYTHYINRVVWNIY